MLQLLWLRLPLGSASGLDIADNGLASFLDADMLNRNLLLTFAAMLVEGFKLLCVKSHKFMSAPQYHVTTIKGLTGQSCSPQTFHRSEV